jgi:hypothetical protein
VADSMLADVTLTFAVVGLLSSTLLYAFWGQIELK